MTANMKKFIESISASNELIEKIGSMTKDELIPLAKELGIELNEADFIQPAAELSDDELDAVSGGDACGCVVGGGGASDGKSKNDVMADDYCACAFAGIGVSNGGGTRCGCVGVGGGS